MRARQHMHALQMFQIAPCPAHHAVQVVIKGRHGRVRAALGRSGRHVGGQPCSTAGGVGVGETRVSSSLTLVQRCTSSCTRARLSWLPSAPACSTQQSVAYPWSAWTTPAMSMQTQTHGLQPQTASAALPRSAWTPHNPPKLSKQPPPGKAVRCAPVVSICSRQASRRPTHVLHRSSSITWRADINPTSNKQS